MNVKVVVILKGFVCGAVSMLVVVLADVIGANVARNASPTLLTNSQFEVILPTITLALGYSSAAISCRHSLAKASIAITKIHWFKGVLLLSLGFLAGMAIIGLFIPVHS